MHIPPPSPILFDGKMGMHAPSHCHHINRICTGWRCMHLAYDVHCFIKVLMIYMYIEWPTFLLLFIIIIIFLLLRWWYTTLKCSMKCTFEHLPLANNHIWPECKRPIRAVCVGKYLKDAPLGRDIICYDCAEDLKEDLAEKGTFPAMTRTRQN